MITLSIFSFLKSLMNNELKLIWSDLCAVYCQDYSIVSKLWKEIELLYSTKSRFYHNLKHLRYMIDMIQFVDDFIERKNVLLFSIFYHDIVYDINKSDNEEKSAAFASERLFELGVYANEINECTRQILATKEHKLSDNLDINYLIDADLSILGSKPDVYIQYKNSVRKEYSKYSDVEYFEGRKKVISYFLNMERIYKTSFFYNNYESQARENLGKELLNLKSHG